MTMSPARCISLSPWTILELSMSAKSMLTILFPPYNNSMKSRLTGRAYSIAALYFIGTTSNAMSIFPCRGMLNDFLPGSTTSPRSNHNIAHTLPHLVNLSWQRKTPSSMTPHLPYCPTKSNDFNRSLEQSCTMPVQLFSRLL